MRMDKEDGVVVMVGVGLVMVGKGRGGGRRGGGRGYALGKTLSRCK